MIKTNTKIASLARKSALSLVATAALLISSGDLWAQDAVQAPAGAQQKAEPIENRAPGSSVPPSNTKVEDDFIIGADDLLAVSVWKEPDLTRVIPVRSDGKISLPLIGELQASERTAHQLEKEIADKLKVYIAEPEVTVMVQEIRSRRFNILGQVAKPGSYLLASSTTVLDAIAMAGGFRDFAKKKSIYVLRQNPDGKPLRLPFNYSEVIKGMNSAENIKLKPRDTIVIP